MQEQTMSAAASPSLKAQSDKEPMPASTTNHSQKSYRRKYRKIMVKFERQMRDSNKLFKDEQRIQDISQRIAEQNDQILNLLLELNSQPQVPPRVRYDLSEPSNSKPGRPQDHQEALEKLRIMRHGVQKGDIEQPDYEDFELDLLDSSDFMPRRNYANLVKRIKLKSAVEELSEQAGTGGFLSSKQEEEYKHSIDEFMNNPVVNPRGHAVNGSNHGMADKSAEREREAQLRNPVSVYNWLRKNQPQVFLQDADHDKPKAAPRTSKRASTNKLAKAEPEMYDEDGFALEANTSRVKRKRGDDDSGYRPKGGHARPTKRRKEDSGRRSKRASMDISAT